MKAETLSRGRPTVSNPMDDTHETFKHLKKAGITEAQAEVFTETFKGLADQTMQVNENLLMVRDELRGEITGVHGEIAGIRGELKDIHHKIDSNYQKLDAKIDDNFQTLDAKIDKNQIKLEADLASTNQEVKHTRETLSIQMDAKFAQALTSNTRWNIGILITMFLGFGGLIVALGGLIITLTAPLR